MENINPDKTVETLKSKKIYRIYCACKLLEQSSLNKKNFFIVPLVLNRHNDDFSFFLCTYDDIFGLY